MNPPDGDAPMEGSEVEGHEHEGMPEVEQPLKEAMFPLTVYVMERNRPGDVVEYIEQWTPGTRHHNRLSSVYSGPDGNQVQELQTPGRERDRGAARVNFHLLDTANIAYIEKAVIRRTYMDFTQAPHPARSVLSPSESTPARCQAAGR